MGAWAVMAWQPVLWPKPWPNMRLRHLETIIDRTTTAFGRRRGQAVWTADCAAGMTGLAWEWVEVRPGVIALADPMNILSNLCVVDESSAPVPDSRRAMVLNRLIHSVDWQPQVRRQLRDRCQLLVLA
jgi:hypothetical protein